MNPGNGVRVDTAIVFAIRLEELAEFYRAGFDLGEPTEAPGHLGFQTPGLYLGFDQVTGDSPSRPGAVTLWFRVEDVDSTYERLLELGATSRYPPALKPWGDYLAALYDPEGNLFGLSQKRS